MKLIEMIILSDSITDHLICFSLHLLLVCYQFVRVFNFLSHFFRLFLIPTRFPRLIWYLNKIMIKKLFSLMLMDYIENGNEKPAYKKNTHTEQRVKTHNRHFVTIKQKDKIKTTEILCVLCLSGCHFIRSIKLSTSSSLL